MRLKRTEQLIMLSISILIIMSIAAVYIRHYDVEQKIELCKSFAIASFYTSKQCMQQQCESTSNWITTVKTSKEMEAQLSELESKLNKSIAFQEALLNCDQLH